MLKIFNDLELFFEDNYNQIHVREYAKLIKISPPTASKILEQYVVEGLLKKEIDKQHHLYSANKESELFKSLQQIYWKIKLKSFSKHVEEQIINPTIILFGSSNKAEMKKTSDLDIAIISFSKKQLKINQFEKKLKRKIQIFQFENIKKIPKDLRKNILNGYKLLGTI